ncbi:branched-chain amino acid ABC transporter permease [Nocardioides sp. GXZ039]|uniref:branched-chain amino acid ABC transporter permease n=1 Tax=Nocardioides sp. GXZ039 TaxID=3136018 RepID=UPI0030F3EA4C
MNSSRRTQLIALAVVALLGFGLPLFATINIQVIATSALFYAYLGTCWNVTGSYGGRLSLGHAIFLGAGAYTSTLLFINQGISPWIGMFLGVVVGAACGALVGWLASRYRLEGIFFAMVTLALTLLAAQLVSNIGTLGGAQGLLVPLSPDGAADYQFADPAALLRIIAVMTMGVLIFTWWLRGRRWGKWIAAVGANDRAAEASGLSPTLVSSVGMAIGGGLTALGGTFYAQQNLFVDPASLLHWSVSLAILLPVIVGGRSRAEGPLVGALLLIPLEELIRQNADPGYAGLLRGFLLIAVVIFMPGGVLDVVDRVRARLRGKTEHSSPEEVDAHAADRA